MVCFFLFVVRAFYYNKFIKPGIFHLGRFEDDVRCASLETLLLQTCPKEVMYPFSFLFS